MSPLASWPGALTQTIWTHPVVRVVIVHNDHGQFDSLHLIEKGIPVRRTV
jgi:hypothetical protein